MEIWKAIKGFEGRYEISDAGRVRSLVSRWGLRAVLLAACAPTYRLELQEEMLPVQTKVVETKGKLIKVMDNKAPMVDQRAILFLDWRL